MSSLLCRISNAFYDIQEILRRITPIEYCETCIPDDGGNCHSLNGTLIIDSNAFIYGQLSFPKCDGSGVGTTINGDGINTGYINADTGYIHELTVDHITIKGGSFGPTGSAGPTGPAGNNPIVFLQEFLPGGDTPWPPSGDTTSIITIDIPTAGVWEILAILSLSNNGVFIDLYSVVYGIDTSSLTSEYYTPMAPFQIMSFEYVQVIQVYAPQTISFNITLTYLDDFGQGYIDSNATTLTAVRLGAIV